MKHYLDTSVLRPLLTASSSYKNYLQEELQGKSYCGHYVKMEFTRGFIIPCMQFYAVFQYPKINSISDALSFWNHNFSSRKLKAVNSLFVILFQNYDLDFENFNDKTIAANLIADYTRRLHFFHLSNRFTMIPQDENLCQKNNVELNFNRNDIQTSFTDFIAAFSDKNLYQKCNLNLFLEKEQTAIDTVIEQKNLKIKNSSAKGFNDIVSKLENTENYTCKSCSKIGDLLISLIAPKRNGYRLYRLFI